MSSFLVQRDGQDAGAAELAPLAFAGYAHFTAMQVRDGRIRGLDLHLDRLRAASVTMFGRAVADERVLGLIRQAVQAGPADLSLTATIYSGAGEFTAADGEPHVLVRTGPASSGPQGPLALSVVEHERTLPTVKHVGEVAKTYYLRQAVADGFDDAAFLDRRDRFGEASIWNLAFWDGAAVVWPAAAMLTGTTMGIVRRQLDRLGVPQRVEPIRPADLPGLAGAVVMNSWTPAVPVNRIGTVPVPEAPEFYAALRGAFEAEPAVRP